MTTKPTKTERIACPNCGEPHETISEAMDCCGDPKPKEAWECGECGAAYFDKDEAKECCAD
jgi:ribosomal protein S27AE